MIIPIRCFTCGKVIAHKWNKFIELNSGGDDQNGSGDDQHQHVAVGDTLDKLQLKRYCCRRMILTHVDLIVKLLSYNIMAGQTA
ncbi:unnamed protein product [Moneuplotes crassus]|uniref:DNA-directed RNA polymerases I, II, and III subunit RPABC5 n=1 Tax=Euplotes crassus TaxID=5936 RepID=A0AAD1XUP7_EUPCR|nr:unnamed protein product [Moneuplotes crassus]